MENIDIFWGDFVVIRYIFFRFGTLHEENLATVCGRLGSHYEFICFSSGQGPQQPPRSRSRHRPERPGN
jgi:hypothetical protein